MYESDLVGSFSQNPGLARGTPKQPSDDGRRGNHRSHTEAEVLAWPREPQLQTA